MSLLYRLARARVCVCMPHPLLMCCCTRAMNVGSEWDKLAHLPDPTAVDRMDLQVVAFSRQMDQEAEEAEAPEAEPQTDRRGKSWSEYSHHEVEAEAAPSRT